MHMLLFLFLIPLVAALVLSCLIVRSPARHAHLSSDHDLSGPQKFHSLPVPRIGGISIFIGMGCGTGWLYANDSASGQFLVTLLICSLPAFLAGLAEDITKNVSPTRRLLFSCLAAGLAIWQMNAVLRHADVFWIDWILAVPFAAPMVTIFLVAGVTNAVNIIDGFNGLASMCVVMMGLAVAWVAWQVGDVAIMSASLVLVGATLGFFAVNYPGGHLFLGDGGAYFLGFLVSQLALLLIDRNRSVSPMFALLLVAYPVFETIFSIYRKKVLRNMSPGVPDGVHLHMLVFKRLVRRTASTKDPKALSRRNAMTSPYLWIMCLFAVAPALLFWDNTWALIGFFFAFCLLYTQVYWRIVRFGVPAWLTCRR